MSHQTAIVCAMRSTYPLLLLATLSACSTDPGTPAPTDASTDLSADAPRDVAPDNTPVDIPPVDAPPESWCFAGGALPQAIVPAGYCARLFVGSPDTNVAHSPVMEPRVMAFAPNGDLFVSAPSTATPGGASGGPGSILVLTDDDHNGIAEVHTFLTGVGDVHGIVFGPDALYYTTTASVMRVSYTSGQRAVTGTATMVSAVPSPGRWTHGLGRSISGSMYVTNGVIAAACPSAPAQVGYVAQLTAGAPTMMAVGLRNPMSIRCHPTTDLCMVAEMGDDGGASYGAREKIFRLRSGTDYGFPCCAGPNLPASAGQNCASVTQEEIVIPLFNSPFGMDWERGLWEGPMRNTFCIAQHGSFYSSPPWLGEGVYCTPTDATSHVPTAGFQLFFSGFSPSNQSIGRLLRPAEVVFAPDGRMFVADDIANAIYYVSPVGLTRPSR